MAPSHPARGASSCNSVASLHCCSYSQTPASRCRPRHGEFGPECAQFPADVEFLLFFHNRSIPMSPISPTPVVPTQLSAASPFQLLLARLPEPCLSLWLRYQQPPVRSRLISGKQEGSPGASAELRGVSSSHCKLLAQHTESFERPKAQLKLGGTGSWVTAPQLSLVPGVWEGQPEAPGSPARAWTSACGASSAGCGVVPAPAQ